MASRVYALFSNAVIQSNAAVTLRVLKSGMIWKVVWTIMQEPHAAVSSGSFYELSSQAVFQGWTNDAQGIISRCAIGQYYASAVAWSPNAVNFNDLGLQYPVLTGQNLYLHLGLIGTTPLVSAECNCTIHVKE